MIEEYFIFMHEIDLIKYATGELSTTDTPQKKCMRHSKYTAIQLRFLCFI